jgi:GH15 family glucan-1,4-alpha-glucosidase
VRDEHYLPLGEYGLIGDGLGAGLVASDGSIDWLCVPRFDSPSLFGRILDHERGGFWRVGPSAPAESTARYRDRTAILETEHRTAGGAARTTDLCLPSVDGNEPSTLVRLCEGLSGELELKSVLEPAADFGRAPQSPEPWGVDGCLLTNRGPDIRLRSTAGQQERRADLTLRQGEQAVFLLEWGSEEHRLTDAAALVESAASYWQGWSEGLRYDGPYLDLVTRSAATLKLLIHAETGALVAAPTMSLPAVIGGDANWDYRYTWLRDSALALYALLALGARAEGDAFFDWVCTRVARTDADEGLRVMYDVDGGSDHEERILSHLEGYRSSRPVRVGNAACTQVQLDVYGEVLDLYATACNWGRADKLDLWSDYRSLADWICGHWSDPDSGIWEQRAPEQHHVYSKVMAWVALDRARRVATENGLAADLDRWSASARAIRSAVLHDGWDAERGAFKQSFDDERADAANLLIPLVGFLPVDDPRALSNLACIREELETAGLVLRFRPREGELTAGEGPFTLCSFWLVNALAAAGQVEEALDVFERAVATSGPLGLFAEHLDPAGRELLGNYPQAFVHAAALSAVVNLARVGVGHAPAAQAAPSWTGHLIPLAGA